MRRHVMMIERPVYEKIDGESARTWEPVVTLAGEIAPAAGVEQVANGKLTATLTHNITIRYVAGLRPNMRVRWNDRVFEIITIKEDPTLSRDMLLRVSELVEG